MTSEVLILNKHAVILGADSAVTTTGGNAANGQHPRYSKTANKIFELSNSGSVAITIYNNAQIDSVPWELVIKLFRKNLGKKKFPKLEDYGFSLMEFLKKNDTLFPEDFLNGLIEGQFDAAVQLALGEFDKAILDPNIDAGLRKLLWEDGLEKVKSLVDDQGVFDGLTADARAASLEDLAPWSQRVADQLAQVPVLEFVNPEDLAILALKIRYSHPNLLFSHTGLVVAGFGEDQIFPAYHEFLIYGHVGNEIAYKTNSKHEVNHRDGAMIKPLAQSSMIDMFTDGFSKSLEDVIRAEAVSSLDSLFKIMKDQGVEISNELIVQVRDSGLNTFMSNWKLINWKNNFHPLLSVLHSLSVPEMAHLAESLLGLQSLKERVTSSSETVGGPIDVAAITKGEGLIWIKRKHFFDASLNMRYASRLDRSYD